MTHCQLYFRILMHTSFSERVVLVGLPKILGSWVPEMGLDLTTSAQDYPHWFNLTPLRVPKGTSLEFKFLVMRGREVVRWEDLKENRSYVVRHEQVVLRCCEGRMEGEEIVKKSGPNHRKSRLLSEEISKKKDHKEGWISEEAGLNLSASRSAPNGEIPNEKIAVTSDAFSYQKLGIDSKEQLLVRKILFNSPKIPKKGQSLLNRPSKEPTAAKTQNLSSKRLKTMRILKMLDNSNSSSSSSFKDEPPPFKKPLNSVKLSALYESLRIKNFEEIKSTTVQDSKVELSQKKHEDLTQNITYDEHILILTLYLPLSVQKKDQDFEFSFLYEKPLFEHESFLITRLLTHYKRMNWIGLFKDQPSLTDEKSIKKLSDSVFDKFKCKPLFWPFDLARDWEIYYKRLWLPLMRNQLDVGKLYEITRNIESHKDSMTKFQQWFSTKIDDLLEENSLVVILDSFLSFLCKGMLKKGIKVALYSQFEFPNHETRLLHCLAEADLLTSFLSTHVLAFNSYKQAKKLIEYAETSVSLGWKTENERGSLYLASRNRKIALKTVYPGLDYSHLEQNLKKSPDFLSCYKSFTKELKGRKVLLWMERLQNCKGVEQRLLFLKRFLQETSNKYKLKVLFLLKVQKNPGALQDELFTIRELVNEINNTVFTNPYASETIEDFTTISLFESPLPKPFVAALMSLSSLFLINTLCEDSVLNIMEFLALNEENGVCLVSEFAGKELSNFNGIFTYNPFRYESFKEKLKLLINLDKDILKEISNNDNGFLRKNSILNWFESIVIELKRNLRRIPASELELQGLYAIDSVILKPLNNELDPFQLIDIYKSCKNRLFFFQSLQIPKKSLLGLKKPLLSAQSFPSEVLKTLEILANDPKNTLFLISDESIDVLDFVAKKIRKMSLLSECGFFYRIDGKQRWRELFEMDLEWKSRVLEIMNQFKCRTEKSQIFNKDSFLVWSFELCDQELARKQACELETLLRSELKQKRNKIEVIRTHSRVEVRPYAVNKANMTELMIQKVFLEKGSVDFMLNFEQYGSERNFARDGDTISEGIMKMLKESPKCFEPSLKSYCWTKSEDSNEEEDFLKLLHRFLALYL